MRRWQAALSALLLVAVLAVPASASAFSKVSQFGVADGTYANGSGQDGYQNMFDTLSGVLGTDTNSFVRVSFSWDPNWRTGLDFGKYDPVVRAAWQDGLTVLPEINLSDNGGPSHGDGPACVPGDCYIDPFNTAECSLNGMVLSADCSMASWQADVKAIAEQYGPGGGFSQEPGNSLFPGITRYEIWNEPNTPTGHGDTNVSMGHGIDFPTSDFNTLMHNASAGLVAGAADTANGKPNWLGSLQIVCCAFGNAGGNYSYAQRYLGNMLAVPGNTVWSDISPSSGGTSAQPGIVSVHMYAKLSLGTDPGTCTDDTGGGLTGGIDNSSEKCPNYLEDYFAPYIHNSTGTSQGLTNQNQPNVGMGITEGGWSGPTRDITTACSLDTNLANLVSQANQATNNAAVIQYYQTHTDIGLQFIANYRALDDGETSSNCWQPGLAPISAGGTTGDEQWKPWAADLHLFAAANDTNAAAAADTFSSRSVGAGATWGTAETGGSYTRGSGGMTDFSVDSSVHKGIMAISGSSQDTQRLDGMAGGGLESQNGSVDITMPTLPGTGQTIEFILGARRTTAGTCTTACDYQATYTVDHSGNVTIEIDKVVNGTTTALATGGTGETWDTGHQYHLVFNAITPSYLPTPATFLTATGYVTPDGIDGNETVSPLVVKDTTNALQVAGTNLWAAKTSWNPSGSFTTKWDNISVIAP